MNKRTLILSLGFMLLMVGFVVAGDFIAKEKQKKINADKLIILKELNLDDYITEDFETSDGYERCIYRKRYGQTQRFVCLQGNTIEHLDRAEEDLIKNLIKREMDTKEKIGEGRTIWTAE